MHFEGHEISSTDPAVPCNVTDAIGIPNARARCWTNPSMPYQFDPEYLSLATRSRSTLARRCYSRARDAQRMVRRRSIRLKVDEEGTHRCGADLTLRLIAHGAERSTAARRRISAPIGILRRFRVHGDRFRQLHPHWAATMTAGTNTNHAAMAVRTIRLGRRDDAISPFELSPAGRIATSLLIANFYFQSVEHHHGHAHRVRSATDISYIPSEASARRSRQVSSKWIKNPSHSPSFGGTRRASHKAA